MKKEWFVILTKPHKEELAVKNFNWQGFSVYLPTIKKTLRHARQTKEVIRPFFPGYLFLQLSQDEQNWTTIAATIGTIGPIRFNDYYPSVPDEVIAELESRENENGHIELESIADKLKSGQSVRILDGEFEGLSGIFQSKRGKDRAIILLDILSRNIKTTVPVDVLE